MLTSVWDDIQSVLDDAKTPREKEVQVDGQPKTITTPFPSPPDWRDQWIYFLMVDRFNNPDRPPDHRPYDTQTGRFQGGTLDGVRQQLGYLKALGVGAIWLTPVLKNCQYLNTFYGYGIQDFLQIDPRFATDSENPDAELQALIDEAHARGMYVIFDVVLNHTGDVFAYLADDRYYEKAPFQSARYPVRWRDNEGQPNERWDDVPDRERAELHPDAIVWPQELQGNQYFRQQGSGGESGGDFESLKELVTGRPEVRNTLIRIHQYLIAKYDVDGFRIDTLKYIEPDFARIFGNAMREYALRIGKKNFFTFGEVYDDEQTIAHFIGRHALEKDDRTGVDAALDFPLFYKLPRMIKGQRVTPAEIANVFEVRKQVQRGIISSHGEVSKYFVTFLDNHDQRDRFYYQDPAAPHAYDDQVTIGLACLFTLQGIPCIYYGTEQGLSGSGNSDQAVRYGRQYFRPLSGDGRTFGLSTFSPGVLAYSRILSDEEVVVVANTDVDRHVSLFVIVDYALNPDRSRFHVRYSNKEAPTEPDPVETRSGDVTIHEVDGRLSGGVARVVKVTLQPMEVQVLGA